MESPSSSIPNRHPSNPSDPPQASTDPPQASTDPPQTYASTELPHASTTMAPMNRSRDRNVHIYDAKDPTTVLGGLILQAGVTNSNFYSMIEIFVLFEAEYFLQDESNTTINRNQDPLVPGKYYIVSPSKFNG
jgi:hypothetical protein